jgi:hypothetical protein
MAERETMLISLCKEVLGPRGGSLETMEHSPQSEYITGILAPKDYNQNNNIEADGEIIVEESSGDLGEDDIEDSVPIGNELLAPALNPKSIPKSMGISILVCNVDEAPSIEVCGTWARYFPNSDGMWARQPKSFLTGCVYVDRETSWETNDNTRVVMKTNEVDRSNGIWRASLFIVNTAQLEEADTHAVSKFVFQPEIRIVCSGNTRLVPLNEHNNNEIPEEDDDDDASLYHEDRSLFLLYNNRPALARGHLTSATWRDIDPQRPHPTIMTPEEPPFFWVDGEIIPPEERSRFRYPDARTDYMPMYPIEAPSIDWNEEKYGLPPMLDPERLAEIFEPDEIRAALVPIQSGYQQWHAEKVAECETLPRDLKPTALAHMQLAQEAITRIGEGINLICDNDEIRLAFCFANKSIALQSRWARNIVYPWRLFQMAFILLNIAGISNSNHSDRNICDLLWFATGGGKTEAYLGLAAFTIGLRRLRSERDTEGLRYGAGTSVISRYTLRLLTIQQYRRALRLITACEYLRVLRVGPTVRGWRPDACHWSDDYLWGTAMFSIGLWVGGGVTPNQLEGFSFMNNGRLADVHGALDILSGTVSREDGEPAQVLSCPCCNTTLAVKNDGLDQGEHVLHLLVRATNIKTPLLNRLRLPGRLTVDKQPIVTNEGSGVYTISITINAVNSKQLDPSTIDQWWRNTASVAFGIDSNSLLSTRASRPGYFKRYFVNNWNNPISYDFSIYCPNPNCSLNQDIQWSEKVPVHVDCEGVTDNDNSEMDYILQGVPDFFATDQDETVSKRVPIPAFTVDEQLFRRCPTMVVATADKFARLAFEPLAASIFGNVEYYHAKYGYYRRFCITPRNGNRIQEHPSIRPALHKRVNRFLPPDLIIQDELHLIEGPLGSMVGIYETAVDELCSHMQGNDIIRTKYIVSTATVRQANTQVAALFHRTLNQFPASGINIDDNFFSKASETHPLDTKKAGRLYVGICAPGKGAQTPLVRLFSSCLQTVYDRRGSVPDQELDGFWTLVGYFNALRELAGAVALLRQDIPQRMNALHGAYARPLTSKEPLELSSRKSSMELPSLLDALEVSLQSGRPPIDVAFATSMFGTGVDIDRLGLMIVNGQPKSTASYIQATGRVGRKEGGLVITFFRASRPRDLNHYEFFAGYHRALYKHVEPVTVCPYSPRARERSLGPLAVILLRQASAIRGITVPVEWRYQQRLNNRLYACDAQRMVTARHDNELAAICEIFEERAQSQPAGRKPEVGQLLREMCSELDRWQSVANLVGDRLIYSEGAMIRIPIYPVVLGDTHHLFQNLQQVFRNTPTSLRDVEATTRFKS